MNETMTQIHERHGPIVDEYERFGIVLITSRSFITNDDGGRLLFRTRESAERFVGDMAKYTDGPMCVSKVKVRIESMKE